MCFSIRPTEIKRFRAVLRCDVDYPSGFSLLSGIGPIGPSMMGSEERSGTIFRAFFVFTEHKERHMHRTHFVHRPARDTSPPHRGTVNSSSSSAHLFRDCPR